MTTDDLKREVAKINWWHRIDLGNGIVTPGLDRSKEKLEAIGLPHDLRGKTVLDIGAWDGFFSFEAERRGASRVLAVDLYSWDGQGWNTKAGFELARKVLNSRVEDVESDVLDLSPEKIGMFDLVLFLGVLYHVRHPLLALEKIFSVTGEQLILETHVELFEAGRPAMVFFPGAELNNDPTNWWGPNPEAVMAMLKGVGFKTVTMHSAYNPLYRRLGSALRQKIKYGLPFLERFRYQRMVFHAWR
jgi:tRNA (mo5U34)-methyltransferase